MAGFYRIACHRFLLSAFRFRFSMSSSLHLLDSWLPRTETFIWQALRKLRRFPPLVMADKRENLEAFPLPDGAFTDFDPVRSLPSKAWARLAGSFAPVRYPGAAAALRDRDIAVTHVHKGFRAVVTRGFTRELGKPLLVSFYGSDVSEKAFLRRARGSYRELFAQARFLLAEGPALRRALIDLGAPPEKVHIQRIAIDPADYAFRERNWDGNRPVRLLFTGRLVEKKGLETGLRALADARIGFPWELTVIGDGSLRASLEALAARLGIRERVRFAGYQSLDEMRAAMQTHDLVLQPSRVAADGDSEGGAPTVLLEAQACGLPILSTTHADIPYVTVPGESAWLAPEGDAGALAGLILRAAEEAGRWGAMGRAGRAKVIADHDVNREIVRLEDLYSEAR
jgi:colanic acid/amylovoran biosynthesis glycosyltransferase